MSTQLEHIRDTWTAAFFNGDFDVLRQYEDENFKVVYEQEGRVEGNYTRYDLIAHAVQNGVWKPQKPNIESEDFEYNADQTACVVCIELQDNAQKIQENWQYKTSWKIVELRFLKP
jgi:hypothetical protein